MVKTDREANRVSLHADVYVVLGRRPCVVNGSGLSRLGATEEAPLHGVRALVVRDYLEQSRPGVVQLMAPSGEWSGRAFWRTYGPAAVGSSQILTTSPRRACTRYAVVVNDMRTH